ncbi:MAG: EAL domain-containing protein [Gammaproteobacteria bacterium]
MHSETGLILLLCAVIVFMRQQAKNISRQKTREQHDKIILSLLDYPVHQHSMTHLLERSLAIIFSAPQLASLPKGRIFLQQNNTLSFAAQWGLNNAHTDNCFCETADSLEFRFTKCVGGVRTNRHGHYIVPLTVQNRSIGVLMLYTHADYQTTENEIELIKSLGQSIAGLIQRKQLADECRLGNNVIACSQQAIFISDKDNCIIRCNKACEQLTGFSAEELIGQNPRIFRSDYQDDYFYKQMWQSINDEGFWQGEVWNKHKDGSVFPGWLTISTIKDADAEIAQYLAIFTDLSNIKKAEQDIRQLAFYDALTQLPNRTLFSDRIQQAVSQAERQHNHFVLLCLDIDHFKNINDSLGHEAGDKLLKMIADRIKNTLRKDDTVARIGGDEFAVIIHDLNAQNHSKIVHIAGKILACLSNAVQLDGHEIIATGSIGISCYPDDADNAVDLIKFADTAMFQAKKAGRNSYQFYTDKFNGQALQKIRLESGLRQALKQNDFMIYLQPQLDLGTMRMTGAEALLRVRSGHLQSISPAEYIAVAEENGLIVEIGDWVFAEVCKLVCHWHDQGMIPHEFKRVAINISPVQFKRHDFVDKIRQSIQETGVPIRYLELELTESCLQEPTHSVLDKLVAIKRMGMTIAIDDFGTGYSSLSRLKQFPIDLLKIDRSFVKDLCSSQSDKAIIQAIVNMAQALNIKTLAEGVETEPQATILRALQCDYYQGFLHSRPIDSKQFTHQLAFSPRLTQPLSNQLLYKGELNAKQAKA